MKLEYCKLYFSNENEKKQIDVKLNNPDNDYSIKIEKGIGIKPTTVIYNHELFEYPDLLVIEDGIRYITSLLSAFEHYQDSFDFKSIGVILDNHTLGKVASHTNNAIPKLITMDFQLDSKIELTETSQAQKNYNLLKSKFSNVPIIGITNHILGDYATDFIKLMRKKRDNVWPKTMIWGVLPALIEDRLAIKQLEDELLEKDDEIKAIRDKKEFAFFQDYFDGDPIDPEDVRSIKIDNYTPSQIMQQYDLAAGTSLAICSMFYEIEGLRNGNNSICVLGEEGTGKNMIPQIIHDLSGKPEDKFVKVECDQLGNNIEDIKDILFGNEDGTFTGVTKTVGKFEIAVPDGTIFLDEIHHLPLKVQASLLNVIQDKSFTNRKGRKTNISNVRIVIGSNQDLHQLTLKEPKEFHSDLLSRISNILKVPNLNDRDNTCIKAIALNQLKKQNLEMGKSKTLSPKALSEFYKINYSDPNLPAKNVREIRRRIERALRRCKEPVINDAWISSYKRSSKQYFDQQALEQHVDRLKAWVPILEVAKENTVIQSELATELKVKQAMISQDLGTKKNDNESKIREIIIQKLLSQKEIEALLKLKSFRNKYIELCNHNYIINMD